MKSFFFLSVFSLLISEFFGNTYYRLNDDSLTVSKKDKKLALTLMVGGKKMLEEGKYRLALLEFKSASQKDKSNHQIFYCLSLTHYKLNNFGYALQYARQANKLVKNKNFDYLLILGKSLHQNNQIDSALLCYQLIDSLAKIKQKKEYRLPLLIASCKYYKTELDSLKKVNIRMRLSDDINSGFSDYAPILIKEGRELYFTSRRENTTGGRNNPDDEQYFEDNYRAVWNDETSKWDSVSNNLERINSQGFDCISFLNSDGLKGLMTLNNTAVAATKDRTKSSDICEISFSNKGKWQTPKVIDNKSINSDYFDGSATMTADGTTMYFVSDRKADKSLTDIYVVKKEGNKWGEAKPVSDSINTILRETTPYITPDGRFLFFSSEGHLGLGGYDIFVSENVDDDTWTKPVNLGLEINSVNDDTHFQYYPKLKKAMFSSFTIEYLKGNLDLFEIDLNNYKLPKTIK